MINKRYFHKDRNEYNSKRNLRPKRDFTKLSDGTKPMDRNFKVYTLHKIEKYELRRYYGSKY